MYSNKIVNIDNFSFKVIELIKKIKNKYPLNIFLKTAKNSSLFKRNTNTYSYLSILLIPFSIIQLTRWRIWSWYRSPLVNKWAPRDGRTTNSWQRTSSGWRRIRELSNCSCQTARGWKSNHKYQHVSSRSDSFVNLYLIFWWTRLFHRITDHLLSM